MENGVMIVGVEVRLGGGGDQAHTMHDPKGHTEQRMRSCHAWARHRDRFTCRVQSQMFQSERAEK